MIDSQFYIDQEVITFHCTCQDDFIQIMKTLRDDLDTHIIYMISTTDWYKDIYKYFYPHSFEECIELEFEDIRNPFVQRIEVKKVGYNLYACQKHIIHR